jgi:F420-dependent oxidoreductase-like protein
MKLGWMSRYWGSAPPTGVLETALAVERLGYDSMWTLEAWGSDALTPLAAWGTRTSRLRLGTNVMQMSARTPAATAMAAMTLDHICGGRFVLGLGVSGPQVVEGWYGQPFAKPLERTREYVGLVRAALARAEPLTSDGPHYPLPLRGGTGLGKPMRLMTEPLRRDLPIMLGAEGPKNIALAAEIADGWIPVFFAPNHERVFREALTQGWSRPGARRRPDDFEVCATVAVVIDDDVEKAADQLRPVLATTIGGFGSRDVNFHANSFARLGFEAEARKIQELFLTGRRDEAIAAVTTEMVEAVFLVGPKAKIREELQAWQESMVTTLIVGWGSVPTPLPTLRTLAELVG